MIRRKDEDNFNCTIQELKHIKDGRIEYHRANFNCTIQELKRAIATSSNAVFA